MFRTAGSKASQSVWRSAAASRWISDPIAISRRSEDVFRRDVSNFASGRRTALRSWKGRHQQFQETAAFATTNIRPSLALGGVQRTFFSPTQQELLGSSRFSPLEEFLMDAIAWTVAFSVWYLLNMEVGDDDLLGDSCDGDKNNNNNFDDRHLEYREDYGPTLSQWPSTPSPGSKRRKTSKSDPKPKEGNRKE